MPVNISITKRMAINLPLSLAADVERLARQDRRSVASWLRNTIEDRVIEALRSEQAADQAADFWVAEWGVGLELPDVAWPADLGPLPPPLLL